MKFKATIYFTILTLTLAACVSSNASLPTAMPTLVVTSVPTTTPASIPTSVPTTVPTSVPTILPTAASTVPFDERLLATFEILEEPDELVFVQGFIWTKTIDGHLVQIDPATNTVIADIKVDTTNVSYHHCQGLGTDGEHIWACSASGDADNRRIDVVRIDPQTQSIIETIKVERIFDQFDMPFLHNQIWVLTGNGDKLVGIDVATNQPSPAIELGTRCFHLAVVDKTLLATCKLDNLVLQIDPEERGVIARATLQSPRYIAATENGVWVLQDNAVVRLDPKSLNPVIAFTNLSSVASLGHIFVTEEAVWIRHDSGFLYRIDPASNEIVEQISTDQSLSGGSVLVTSDSIWATANNDNLLIRLSLE